MLEREEKTAMGSDAAPQGTRATYQINGMDDRASWYADSRTEEEEGRVERGRCEFCPTMWVARYEKMEQVSPTLVVEVFQDLGGGGVDAEGRDGRWRHLTGRVRRRYKWADDEELEGAFKQYLIQHVWPMDNEFDRYSQEWDGHSQRSRTT
jgi:hypothetical protein